jgi:hypothetical protein
MLHQEKSGNPERNLFQVLNKSVSGSITNSLSANRYTRVEIKLRLGDIYENVAIDAG